MSTSTCTAYSSVAEYGIVTNAPLSTSAPSYEKAPGSGRRSGSVTSKDGDMVCSHHLASYSENTPSLCYLLTRFFIRNMSIGNMRLKLGKN